MLLAFWLNQVDELVPVRHVLNGKTGSGDEEAKSTTA